MVVCVRKQGVGNGYRLLFTGYSIQIGVY